MRVIEPPNKHRRPTVSRAKSKKRPLRTFTLIGLLFIAGFAFLSLANSYRDTALNSSNQQGTLATSTIDDLRAVAGARDVKFKYYAGDQFQRLYESILYPNNQPISSVPSITGDTIADARIRTIAESRGYVLRSVPVLPIVQTKEPRLEDDDLLQPKAYRSWQVLKEQAKASGLNLVLNSGYRSVELQRTMFTDRLRASGINTTDIVSGRYDNQIVQILSLVSPPGYSRHHTGYTVDLACDDGGASKTFKQSKCFKWLSANNYDHAKRSGWVPSYPEGASEQGPEPEPWEYVWLGVDQLAE